jgi:hypothetical protein
MGEPEFRLGVSTQQDLKNAKCTVPGCTHEHDNEPLTFGCPVCSGEQAYPSFPSYREGTLLLSCAKCYRPFMALLIAHDDPLREVVSG